MKNNIFHTVNLCCRPNSRVRGRMEINMKKYIILLLCLIATLTLSACNNSSDVMNKENVEEDNEEYSSNPSSAPTEMPTEAATPAPTQIPDSTADDKPVDNITNTPASEPSDAKDYEIVGESFTKGEDIIISYPQIDGLKDASVQSKVNDLLKEAVMSYYDNLMDPEVDLDISTLEISYEIIFSGNSLLSVEFFGWDYYAGAAHPNNIYFTKNINMKTGELISLKDLFYVDELLISGILKNGKYVAPLDPEDAEFVEMVHNDMLVHLSEYGLSENEFTLTKDSLSISIYVSHAIGDYAVFATKYSDLMGSIKYDNELWRDFPEVQEMAKEYASQKGDSSVSHIVKLGDVYRFTEFKNQSFDVELENWGDVRFVSGWDFDNKLCFYLTDDKDTILYRFPGYYNNWWYNQTISAVAFRDVNEDGLKDVIILALRNNEFTTCDIYFQKGGEFVQVPELYTELNESDRNYDTINKVVDYMKTDGKVIANQALN